MNLRLYFDVPTSGCMSLTARGLTMACESGKLECNAYTDFRDIPLVLTADCVPGDHAELILMPHRIELHINGILIDEEWPAGRLLFDPAEPPIVDCPVSCEEYVPTTTEQPSVISTFANAEGWRPGGNVYVGYCMPYVDDGRYHVLYLKDRRHHQSKWRLGAHQWEHISTDDFVTWQVHPMAVAITDPMEGSICTGSWIKRDDTHYLYYTVRMADGSPARICRSVSKDGYHFEKDADFAFSLSDKYHGPSARDPKLILDDNGIYHMLLTTSIVAESRGCLAHLISHDMDNWEECAQPIYISAEENQPECPDYFKYGDYYYLIYSLHGSALYLFSENPFGPWHAPENPHIPCESVPKAGIWQGRIIFTGFTRINGYAGTLAFKTATAAKTGELTFE